MAKNPSFKEEFTFDQRLEESRDIIAKYPNGVIVERYSKADLPEMEKKNVSGSSGHVCWTIHSHLKLETSPDPWKSTLFVCEEHFTLTATLMDSVYEYFKEDDGFLYRCCRSEKTFS